jgi:hypothetical protein
LALFLWAVINSSVKKNKRNVIQSSPLCSSFAATLTYLLARITSNYKIRADHIQN